MIGGFIYVYFFVVLLLLTLIDAFENVSEDLYVLNKGNSNLHSELERIMTQHDELWRFTSHLNGPFNYVLTILYGILLSETSLMYFAFIFSEFKFALKLFFSSLCVSFTFLCIVTGFLFSAFTSTMQTSFQDIRRFAGCDFTLEQKLKILNFMKRFGKEPLCFTFRNYFKITKKFPIKMGNSLHSMFSGLLNIKKAS
ncbi:uncharacterized protein [Centruroides vittatus]|uniref:uncharacterized protein n=1 Tax=Centruroides vittatus TaxID=120091 RepID=UPI00350EC914